MGLEKANALKVPMVREETVHAARLERVDVRLLPLRVQVVLEEHIARRLVRHARLALRGHRRLVIQIEEARHLPVKNMAENPHLWSGLDRSRGIRP